MLVYQKHPVTIGQFRIASNLSFKARLTANKTHFHRKIWNSEMAYWTLSSREIGIATENVSENDV